ncbi:hypothetical protein [Actinomadura rifamycini]|uniref:hypothetical protein n=1 Tax=Actinomadura rifamycini TaxID=31962 RepID=UPI0012F80153|nr:hypothetical protein [Actinomadura rifamycini]
MQRTHRLRMVRVAESGFEEWACPVCGRRMLLRWPPDCRKEVVDRGDEGACHVADRDPGAADGPRDGPVEGSAESAVARREPSRAGVAVASRRRLRETGVRFPVGEEAAPGPR